MRRGFLALITLVSLILPSCGPGNGLTLARVRGTVTYEGQPIKFG